MKKERFICDDCGNDTFNIVKIQAKEYSVINMICTKCSCYHTVTMMRYPFRLVRKKIK